MGNDVWLVVQWWGTLFLVGAAAYPLTRVLFQSRELGSGLNPPAGGWHDRGYFFSKAVGMAVVGWVVYVLGTVRVLSFTTGTIIVSLVLLFIGGHFLDKGNRGNKGDRGNAVLLIITEELFFFAALLFWSWIKAHEPGVRGLEKFMDYGFMQSVLNSQYFPPADMWYAGSPINYYYFGHLITAVLTKLSGIDLAYTFNLMLATIFALCFTMSFSIGYQLFSVMPGLTRHPEKKNMDSGSEAGMTIKRLIAGMLTAFLVTLAGNLQTLYAFTRGYTGDNVQAFWQLLWKVGEFWQKLPEGLNTYWYANATRFIPFTIHEFPSYSFVVSDVHGHVLSIPFVLLAIALLMTFFIREHDARDSLTKRVGRTNTTFLQESLAFPRLIFYGFLVGILLMTNALDGPIYFGLFALIFILRAMSLRRVEKVSMRVLDFARTILPIGVVVVTSAITVLPFLLHFKSFVTGIAVNCPLPFLANTNIGPLIFEGVEKCQRSPVWMVLVLWGFFLYCGLWFVFLKKRESDRSDEPIERVLKVFFWFSVALIIFPEFFYFKDIYPAHFRSNTMFKLGYQAFILFSIVAGYTIVNAVFSLVIRDTKYVIRKTNLSFISRLASRVSQKFFVIFLIPQLFLVSIYPIFSVRSYFNSLKNYEGLYGLNWLAKEYPDDYAAIQWLNLQPTTYNLQPIIVEADGDSYTDYNRFSAFTGIPTVVGWAVHEWLWRGGYEVVAPRREVVRLIYEAEDDTITKDLLARFNVRYVVIGTLERQKYPSLVEEKFPKLGRLVFEHGETKIYEMLATTN